MTPNDSQEKRGSGPGSVLCRQLAQTVLDDFTDALIDMVENSPHGLSIEEIREFKTRYQNAWSQDGNEQFKMQFQRCLDRREQEVFDPNRRYPFKRMLTMSFVDLFAPEGELDDSGTYLSRRMLPGLFYTLEKMVGFDPFDAGHAVCTAVLEQAKNDDGVVVWERLYENVEAQDTIDDLLMALVPYFDNPMRRLMWMLGLINNNLADPRLYDFEGAANRDWQLDERGLIQVMRHLFRHLRRRLKDKEQAQGLSQRYGAERVRQLAALITALDRAEV